MQKLKILNTREVKEILRHLKEQFGYEEKLDYVFLLSEKDKIYIINKDIERIDLEKIRINTMGIYFGTLQNNEGLRLSVEGSQIIGDKAKKNIVELDDNERDEWFKGIEIEKDAGHGFVLIRHGNDLIGCGKAMKGKIHNYLPKIRRIC